MVDQINGPSPINLETLKQPAAKQNKGVDEHDSNFFEQQINSSQASTSTQESEQNVEGENIDPQQLTKEEATKQFKKNFEDQIFKKVNESFKNMSKDIDIED